MGYLALDRKHPRSLNLNSFASDPTDQSIKIINTESLALKQI